MKDSELRTRAKAIALKIICVCDNIDTKKGRGVLVNQITRSATSIGANIHEANYASSKADFINKFHIALKECSETEYWIEMLIGSNCISEETAKELLQECGIIRRRRQPRARQGGRRRPVLASARGRRDRPGRRPDRALPRG